MIPGGRGAAGAGDRKADCQVARDLVINEGMACNWVNEGGVPLMTGSAQSRHPVRMARAVVRRPQQLVLDLVEGSPVTRQVAGGGAADRFVSSACAGRMAGSRCSWRSKAGCHGPERG